MAGGPILSLRPYQAQAIAAVQQAEKEGYRRVLEVLPTGTGKTVVFSHLAKERGARTVVLVHRDELIQQAAEKFSLVWPDAEIGIVKAGRSEVGAQVVIASVQTLRTPGRTEALLAAGPRDLVVVDEAHHAVASTYRIVLGALRAFERDGPLVVGYTATPERADGVGLHVVFERIVFERTILEMVLAGYLVEPIGRRIETNLDLSGVRIRGGDYEKADLAKAVNRAELNAIVADAYVKEGEERRAIAFGVDVAHAESLAEALRKRGVAAAVVHGRMSMTERRQMIRDFRKGRIHVLCNADLLTEGFDEPSVAAVIMARPTKSKALYLQMIGRGTRLHPTKKNCLIFDFVNNTKEHSLLTLPVLFGANPKEVEANGGSVVRTLVREAKVPEIHEVGEWTSETVDLFGRSALQWIPVETNILVLDAGDVGRVYLRGDDEGWRVYLVSEKGRSVQELTQRPLDIGYAQGVAEDFVRTHARSVLVLRDAKWHNREASSGQREALARYRYPVPPDLKAGEASRILTYLIARNEVRRIFRGGRPPAQRPPA